MGTEKPNNYEEREELELARQRRIAEYLHEELDTWFVDEIQPRMRGKSFRVRYADDAVLGFEEKEDAERVMAVVRHFWVSGITGRSRDAVCGRSGSIGMSHCANSRKPCG